MRVLVTGGAGFVGSHVVDALVARGDEVHIVDRRIGLDLTDPQVSLDAMARRPDAVIHLAASCSTSGSIRDPLGTFRDTVLTTANLFEAVRLHPVPVIVTSSVKARDGLTPYGAAKRMVETWATEQANAYGIPVVINRPGTIYGPGQEGSAESGWLAWFLKAKAEDRTVTVYGSGAQRRDLLHVSDYVRLLLTQLDDIPRYVGPIWDVGGGLSYSVHDVVDFLGLRHVHDAPRYGDAAEYIGINDVPGWEPRKVWMP